MDKEGTISSSYSPHHIPYCHAHAYSSFEVALLLIERRKKRKTRPEIYLHDKLMRASIFKRYKSVLACNMDLCKYLCDTDIDTSIMTMLYI